ncbi:hypothetical protein [Collinsella intestinalis]|uniref:hypothetical protein n=1 Tax=Collinsella intestinalis TaxID=147207 RepID=UPI0026714548|nr:hypothetical protein [Collinsella intestinalis]
MLNEQIVADNRALIARNRELECELEQLKAKLGAVERIADKYHEKASTILSGWGDKPMGGTDLGRFHAFEQMVGEIWEVFD